MSESLLSLGQAQTGDVHIGGAAGRDHTEIHIDGLSPQAVGELIRLLIWPIDSKVDRLDHRLDVYLLRYWSILVALGVIGGLNTIGLIAVAVVIALS